MPDSNAVKGAEFLRRLKKVGKARNIAVRVVASRGKGDHMTVHFGDRRTILGDLRKEIKTGTLHAMLKQLGLNGLED